MLDAAVEQVAADAASPEQASPAHAAQVPPLAYRTALRPAAQVLLADGVPYRLAAGMQVTAEIRLGERTVLEYLLSPIRKAFHEAGRER